VSSSEETVEAVDQLEAAVVAPAAAAVAVAAAVVVAAAAVVVVVLVEAETPAVPWLPRLDPPSPPEAEGTEVGTASLSRSSGSKLKLGLELVRGMRSPAVTVVVEERIRSPAAAAAEGFDVAADDGGASELE